MTGWRPPDPIPARGEAARDGDPVPVGRALDRLLDGMGAPTADVLATLFDRWVEIAGPTIADHSAPASCRSGILVVRVDHPSWATEVRYRQGELLRRIDAAVGAGAVERIEVRVGGGG